MTKKIKYTEFGVCEICAGSPAIYRSFCGKTLCTDCARNEFQKYLKTLLAGLTILVISLLVIGNL